MLGDSPIPEQVSLEELNLLSSQIAQEFFLQVCHSQRWATAMVNKRPFASVRELRDLAQELWSQAEEADILEAFGGHARIGDLSALQEKFSAAATEQGQVAEAPQAIIEQLFEENNEYYERNGFIFIVCATGKSAGEMLTLLRTRSFNSREQELINGAAEQSKITALRLAQRVR